MGKYDWRVGKEYREIRYELCDGVAKISINRPERRNAFTPLTVMEMYDAFSEARDDASVGVILLTGVNHGGRHEDEAFCSGGGQKKRGNGGYVGEDNIPRLNVLDLQRLIRVVPKPVIAMVNGYAIGGEQSGHVILLHHATTGDGELTAGKLLKLLAESGKKMSELNGIYEQYPQVLVNVTANAAQKAAYKEDEVLAGFIENEQQKLMGMGRVLVRVSGTEPKLRVMVEGQDLEAIHRCADRIVEKINKRILKQ